MKKETVQYRRNLPHILPPGATYFVTYRLHGSIPRDIYRGWEADLEWQKKLLDKQALHPDILKEQVYILQKRFFAQMDSYLDANPNGPYESYDHYARNDREFERILAYIANNPVKAGLVDNWQDWKWTYVHPDLL